MQVLRFKKSGAPYPQAGPVKRPVSNYFKVMKARPLPVSIERSPWQRVSLHIFLMSVLLVFKN